MAQEEVAVIVYGCMTRSDMLLMPMSYRNITMYCIM